MASPFEGPAAPPPRLNVALARLVDLEALLACLLAGWLADGRADGDARARP